MKKSVVAIFVCVMALLFPSFVLGQFGMGCCCCPADVPGTSCATSCVTVGNVTVVPWLGFGYQSLGLNVNHPFNGTANRFGYFSNLDVRLKNNALWVGSLGFDLCLRQRLRFFGGFGTNLFVSNGGSLGTENYYGISYSGGRGLDWQCNQTRWWELNLGGLYCLTDDVAILIGYKCDSLSEKPERGMSYAAPDDESYSADFKAITRSPYIGIKICQCNVDVSLVWSPWLTSYDVKIPLSVNATFDYNTEGYYSLGSTWGLSGGGGNLLEAFAQAKLNVSRWASMLPCACDGGVNLWLRGSWLQCRGNGNLDQSGGYIDASTADLSGSGSGANSLFTRYLWALGISGQLLF